MSQTSKKHWKKYFLSSQVCKMVTSFLKTKNCFQPLSMVAALLYFEQIYFKSQRSLKPSLDHKLKRWSLKHNIPTSRFLLTSEITINKKKGCWVLNAKWEFRGQLLSPFCQQYMRQRQSHILHTFVTYFRSSFHVVLHIDFKMLYGPHHMHYILCSIDYRHSTPAL